MSLGTNSKCINQGDGGQWSLGTMIIKCKTRKRERGGGGGGGHLPLGTLIIKYRTREREGGSLASRNNDY